MTPVPIECKTLPDGNKPTTRLTISRNYVVPPRPKPGRKPSLDAPASKRKAQNRESQRIYRERKAVAVKQLEAQIADQAQEFEKKQRELQSQIDQLIKQSQKNGDQSRNQSPNSRSSSNPSSPRPEISVAPADLTERDQTAPTTPYIPLHAAAPSPPGAYFADMSEFPNMGRYLYPPNVHAFNSMNGNCPSPGESMIPIQGYAIGPPGSSPIPIGMSPLPLSHPISISPLAHPVMATPMSPADVVGLELLDHVLEQKLPVGGSNASSKKSSVSSLLVTSSAPQPLDAKTSADNTDSTSLDSPKSLQALNSPKPNSAPNSAGSSPSVSSPSSGTSSSHSPNSPKSPKPGAFSKRYEPPTTTDPLELMASEWTAQAKPLRRSSGPLEIDFTNKFRTIPRPLVAKADRCGFCTGDNVCVCAEAALREAGDFIDEDTKTLDSTPSDSENITDRRSAANSPKSPKSPKSPSDRVARDIGSAVHQTTRSSPEAVCSGDPGACERCQEDPMLSLFCAALAAKESVVSTGTFISSLQAYKTLKRHPNFSRCDLGALIRDLNVGLRGQVDVSSIAKCLRTLD